MTEMVQFSFALSPRMRAFIEIRDALACIEKARLEELGTNWLHAACDLHDSLLGDQGRKNVIPEIIALFADVQAYLGGLAAEAPDYQESILAACDKIKMHVKNLQPGLPDACSFLADDALINAYLNAQKKHDWLGHKLCIQQSINTLWTASADRTSPLHTALTPLNEAVEYLDHMLGDFVAWKKCVATHGTGHITPERGKHFELLIISMPAETVAKGIMPDISGNRLAIRIRFQLWTPGLPPSDYDGEQPYSMMLVPVGI
ncbi:MAG: hypothetical protein Q9M31_08315 [Mariprofundus sp.]|nr:hypothetical protein [Mariprofundus sp.]